MTSAWILSLGGLLAVGYVLVGYAALLALRARLAPRPPRLDPTAEPPRVSLLISAYCESRDLPRKIASLWRLDYPADRFEVLVADDGSSDGTGDLVEQLAAQPEAAGRLKLLPRTENLGKASQLNRLAAAASGEVLVLTDARQPLEPGALRHLVAVFADEAVGGASGAVEYRTPEGEPVTIGLYWRYESLLREWEGLVHSCCGGAGPLMALRRDLWTELPPDTVLDDVLQPMRLVLAGHRFVYVPEAVAVETYAMNRRHEYQRRVRTMAGNVQLLRLEPRLLLPWRNPIWWQFVSHKVGRVLLPWLLLALLLGSLLGLGAHPFFGLSLVGQAVVYGYALIGWATAGRAWSPPGAQAAYSLVLLAVCAVAGLVRDLRGGSRGSWGKAEAARRS